MNSDFFANAYFNNSDIYFYINSLFTGVQWDVG